VTWGAAAAGKVVSAADMTFGPFSADPPNVTHAFLCDAASGTTGNVLAYWTLNRPRDVASGKTLTFYAGRLTLTVA
jgi:hypothetical protein